MTIGRHYVRPEESLRNTELTVDGQKKEIEVSGLLPLAVAMLTLLSASLSLLWFNRIF